MAAAGAALVDDGCTPTPDKNTVDPNECCRAKDFCPAILTVAKDKCNHKLDIDDVSVTFIAYSIYLNILYGYSHPLIFCYQLFN